METNIYLKRSLFRLNKKFWGKRYETYLEGNFKSSIMEEISNMNEQIKMEIEQRLQEFAVCKSRATANSLEK